MGVPDAGLTQPAAVRAHLYGMLEREPEVFRRMAMRWIRRLRPVLGPGDALSVAGDAIERVARSAERGPVRPETVLGLVRHHVRWAALDQFRALRPDREIPAGLGGEYDRDEGGDLLTRASLRLPEVDQRAAFVLREADELAMRLAAAAGAGSPSAPAAGDTPAERKRRERARGLMVAWTRLAVRRDRASWLEPVILGDQLPGPARRGQNGRLLAWLGLDGLAPPEAGAGRKGGRAHQAHPV